MVEHHHITALHHTKESVTRILHDHNISDVAVLTPLELLQEDNVHIYVDEEHPSLSSDICFIAYDEENRDAIEELFTQADGIAARRNPAPTTEQTIIQDFHNNNFRHMVDAMALVGSDDIHHNAEALIDATVTPLTIITDPLHKPLIHTVVFFPYCGAEDGNPDDGWLHDVEANDPYPGVICGVDITEDGEGVITDRATPTTFVSPPSLFQLLADFGCGKMLVLSTDGISDTIYLRTFTINYDAIRSVPLSHEECVNYGERAIQAFMPWVEGNVNITQVVGDTIVERAAHLMPPNGDTEVAKMIGAALHDHLYNQ